MPKFKASSVISMLKRFTDEEKNKKTQSCPELKNEIKNVLDDTKIILYKQSREDAIKYILWQGLLNRYGIFGATEDNTAYLVKIKQIIMLKSTNMEIL